MLVFLFILSQVSYQATGHWDLSKIGVAMPGPYDVQPDGGFAVFSVKTGKLIIIGSDGRLKSKCGAEGKGSGEFQSPQNVQWLDDEKVFAVFDITNRRISKWDQNGTLVEEFTFPKPLKDPRILKKDLVLASRYAPGLYGKKPAVLAFNPKDQSSRVLWEHDLGGKIIGAGADEGDRNFTVLMPWNPLMQYDAGSDFFAVAFGDSNMVHILDFEGNALTAPIPVNLPSIPLTDEQYEKGFEKYPPEYKAHASVISVRPSMWPLIREILVDDQNRIWVFGSSQGLGHPFPYQVYDANGTFLTDGKVGRIPSVIMGNSMYAFEDMPRHILQKIDFKY